MPSSFKYTAAVFLATLVLAALLGHASAHHTTSDVYLHAASNASFLGQRLAAFEGLYGGARPRFDIILESGLGLPVPAVGSPWPLWDTAAYVTGDSFFTVGGQGVPTVIVPALPYVQYVDPVNKVFFNANPLAGQYTNATASWIWTLQQVAPGVFVDVCFINATASFDNQRQAHYSVAYQNTTSLVPIRTRFGTYYAAAAGAFGTADDFGGGNYADMSFGGDFALGTNFPLRWWFSQPATTAKVPPGPGPCAHNFGTVGGMYDATGVGATIGPLNAAPAGIAAPPATCQQPLDWNTFICAN